VKSQSIDNRRFKNEKWKLADETLELPPAVNKEDGNTAAARH
jgi:hypothetical protein